MYKPTIGLEIHTELKTKTKMFCGCLNFSVNLEQIENQPNINICPVCLAHPGTLPAPNKEAIKSVVKLGLALGGKIAKISKFDRKNYFYPDLPKGYQISQYDQPFVLGGMLNSVKITRVHLEEDTARLIHSEDGKSSLVDFNRAGVPLMELVTEPDIKNGKEAVYFAKELRLIMKYLGISNADMEKGQMRVEANISISKDKKLGTKVEIKNLNSFRAVEEAIDYEIKRQEDVLEKEEKVVQETRGWDENKKSTFSQRLKEEAHDYRYFSEPDIPSFDFSKSDFINIEELKSFIPELPVQKRERFIKEYGLKPDQVEILVEDKLLGNYFEQAISELFLEIGEDNKEKNINLLFNYLTSDVKGYLNELKIGIESLKITSENFADLIVLIIKGEISSRIAKDLIKDMHLTGNDPRRIIQEKGLGQISDEETIGKIIEEVIAENQKAFDEYRQGNENVLQFLVGKTMGKLKGRGNPAKIIEIIKKII